MAANIMEDPTIPDIFIEPENLLTKLIRYGKINELFGVKNH